MTKTLSYKNLGYAGNVYDIKNATRGNVIYPPVDPSIWEVRYSKVDLQVRTIDV
jgi:hypothetical protein